MGDNALNKATRNAFGSLHHLEWLDLSVNNIYDIDFDAFKNTHRLQVSWFCPEVETLPLTIRYT
jgi:hypothetical protein